MTMTVEDTGRPLGLVSRTAALWLLLMLAGHVGAFTPAPSRPSMPLSLRESTSSSLSLSGMKLAMCHTRPTFPSTLLSGVVQSGVLPCSELF